MSVFDTWLKGQVIKDHITNPNIIVGDYSYYSASIIKKASKSKQYATCWVTPSHFKNGKVENPIASTN